MLLKKAAVFDVFPSLKIDRFFLNQTCMN